MFRKIAYRTTVLASTLAVAAVALAGCSAAGVSSAGGSSVSSAGASASSAPAAQSAPSVRGLNTPVTVGSFQYSVAGAKDIGPTVGTSPFTQTAQGTYIQVDLTISNVGNASATFLSNYVKLKDAAGKTFDADATASLYANPNQQAWVASINPGNSLSGPILFDVPAGTQAATVLVSDNAFIDGKPVRLQ